MLFFWTEFCTFQLFMFKFFFITLIFLTLIETENVIFQVLFNHNIVYFIYNIVMIFLTEYNIILLLFVFCNYLTSTSFHRFNFLTLIEADYSSS